MKDLTESHSSYHEERVKKWQTEFKKGFSKPIILLVLSEQSSYPYRLTRLIREKTNDEINITGSNIYPILSKLEMEGIISSDQDKETGRKYYRLTSNGNEFLSVLKTSLKGILVNTLELINKKQESV